jgi:hypothetical protein
MNSLYILKEPERTIIKRVLPQRLKFGKNSHLDVVKHFIEIITTNRKILRNIADAFLNLGNRRFVC